MILRPANIRVFDHENTLVDFTVRYWTNAWQEAVGGKGVFCVALSGGKTPQPIYQRLASQKGREFWERTHLFLVDERFVPLLHPESNFQMIARMLIHPANIPPENIHAIAVDKGTPEAAAREYEENLRSFFKTKPGEVPVFDLILLGIGEDGHTASLFPGTRALEETGKLAVAVRLDESRHDRVTLTFPILNRADRVIFIAAGRRKAEIVRRIICEKTPALPASRVQPISGDLIFALDREAGEKLSVKAGCPGEEMKISGKAEAI